MLLRCSLDARRRSYVMYMPRDDFLYVGARVAGATPLSVIFHGTIPGGHRGERADYLWGLAQMLTQVLLPGSV